MILKLERFNAAERFRLPEHAGQIILIMPKWSGRLYSFMISSDTFIVYIKAVEIFFRFEERKRQEKRPYGKSVKPLFF